MSIGLIGGGRQREKRGLQHRVHRGDPEGAEKRRADLKRSALQRGRKRVKSGLPQKAGPTGPE
jgi:hypothetical protein